MSDVVSSLIARADRALLSAAREALTQHQRVSVRILCVTLQIRIERAERLLDALQAEGFITAKNGRGARALTEKVGRRLVEAGGAKRALGESHG